MANQQTFTNQDIDRMKNDAIKRARQMQSRATIVGGGEMNDCNKGSDKTAQTKEIKASSNNVQSSSKPVFLNGINDIISQLGLNSEQLIIFAIILILCENRDNRFLIMALIYIAL